jgi:exocyst complex component 4
MVEDAHASKNPEADSLSYIRLLLESLNNLGHLPNAIATVNQRLPVELFKLVDKTNIEVDQRHPSSLTGLKTRGYHGKTVDLGLNENDVRVTIIHDLLCTLYSKFEAVMEGYRVIYDVVKGITNRGNSLQDAESWKHGFAEMWQLIQSEVIPPPSPTPAVLIVCYRCGPCYTII